MHDDDHIFRNLIIGIISLIVLMVGVSYLMSLNPEYKAEIKANQQKYSIQPISINQNKLYLITVNSDYVIRYHDIKPDDILIKEGVLYITSRDAVISGDWRIEVEDNNQK